LRGEIAALVRGNALHIGRAPVAQRACGPSRSTTSCSAVRAAVSAAASPTIDC